MQKAAAVNLPMEKVKEEYDRCHRYFSEDNSDLGDPLDWLQRSTAAHYAPAQAQTANLRLLQDHLKASAKAAGVAPEGYAALPPIGGDTDPRELLRDALSSLDPNVIQQVGHIVPDLDRNEPRDVQKLNRLAWAYVACLRGADCSMYGQPSLSTCAPTDTNCKGVPQHLLEMAHFDWAPVQERANTINAALDAKQWDKLGLGS